MDMTIFAVWDAKALAFLEPFFMPTAGMAIRSFHDAVNKQGTQFNQHPEDYSLWQIGMWYSAEGLVKPLDHGNVQLESGIQVRREVSEVVHAVR